VRIVVGASTVGAADSVAAVLGILYSSHSFADSLDWSYLGTSLQ